MKINARRKITKKKLLIISLCGLILLLSIGASFYAIKKNMFGWSPTPQSSPTSTINYDKPTEEQKNAAMDVKANDTAKEATNSAGNPSSDKKTKNDIIITAANQNNSTLQVRVEIPAVTDIGLCTLTLTREGHSVVTKTAPIQALASNSTCKGFDIATDELSPGTWKLQLHFENDNSIGDTSKEITIQ